MNDLPTPDPSSDPLMPGSSPSKPSRGVIKHSIPSASMPFSVLDLNTIGQRAKAFQTSRQKANETPPPSSPPSMALGFSSSPTKPDRSDRRLNRLVEAETIDIDTNAGLVPNPDQAEAAEMPHILYASPSHSLIIGRSKPLSRQDSPVLPTKQGLGSKKAMRVNLPNDAKHVSRIHSIIEWIPFVPRTNAKGSPDEKDTSTGTYIVRVVGQNGLIVDGKRRREGQVLRLTPGKSVLDFFGLKCRVELQQQQEGQVEPLEQESKDVQSPVKLLSFAQSSRGLMADLPSSPPATSELPFLSSPRSSPSLGRKSATLVAGASAQRSVMIGASDNEEPEEDDSSADEEYVPDLSLGKRKLLEEEEDQVEAALAASEEEAETPVIKRQRTSSGGGAKPKKSSAVAETLTESQTKMPPPVIAAKASALRSASNSPAPGSSMQDLQAEARRCVRLLAPTYDLEGLLAGAIVFHRTATISASEAVRSVLATTPGLMEGRAGDQTVAYSPSRRSLSTSSPLPKGNILATWPISEKLTRKAWREFLEIILQSSPMFGVIHRAGKDASGNPLECWYYYDKENDPDKERAENLGAFVKPMRKAIKGQKPIFWKKSGYGSKEGDFDVPKGVWEETQPEEKEKTWDRVGDLDWKKGK